jgi:acetyl esterase/lipase
MSAYLPSLRRAVSLCLLAGVASAIGAEATAPLPPLPPPMNIPKPGPVVNGVYQPQPILPGGVVVPLFPPDSPYLNKEKLGEAEVYRMNDSAPGRFANITNIHNPSIEFHATSARSLNTGMAVIVAAGGGHNTLNVGGESADFVYFFSNYGINTVILRNRLRSSGYNPQVDAVADAQQAIKLVRAYAKEWNLDPNKIGIMGFSAGAELAAPAAIKWAEFDAKNDVPGNPFARISSRPDFAGIIYPGPTPFTPRGGRGGQPAQPFEPPAIPNNTPPSFIVCAGWGDRGHAVWADDWFRAMLNANVPNVEMHIYARGRHPGDQPFPGDPPSTGGLTDRGGIAFGTWHLRFIDWARDMEFLGKPGVETRAARDIVANIERQAAGPARRGGRGQGGRGAEGPAAAPGVPPPAGTPPAPATK